MRSLWSSIALLSAFLNASQRSLALHLELPRRSPTESLPNIFARADDNSTSSLAFLSGGYNINITLNGAPFTVIIDTGRCVGSTSVHPSPFLLYPPLSLSTSALTVLCSPCPFSTCLALTFGSRGQCLMPKTWALVHPSTTPWAQAVVCVPCYPRRTKTYELTQLLMRALRMKAQ
jgi:hypothetical protein